MQSQINQFWRIWAPIIIIIVQSFISFSRKLSKKALFPAFFNFLTLILSLQTYETSALTNTSSTTMEAEQKRSKRKPLSDCTNINLPTRRKNPHSSSSSKFPNSQTLIKPPKSTNPTANTLKNNPSLNPNPSTCSSPKSHTSTGSSNYPTNSSIHHSPDPPAPPTPLSDTGGADGKKSRLSTDQSQRHDATTRKDKGKGKMVADTPIIQLSASLTSNSLQISSSAAPVHCSRSEIQSIQSQELHAQTIKDKGKAIADDPVIPSPAPWVSKYVHSSSSITSSGSLSETSATHSQKLHIETRKDKGKMVLETLNMEASEPSTPHASLPSLSASGTQERPVTVYNQRRARKGRKDTAGKINSPLTCPPDQRIKNKGLELDYDRGNGKSGSHTDPLPVHKKKRSRGKDGGSMHVLPQEEVEKLRAYYADIDAFELAEEVASESELE